MAFRETCQLSVECDACPERLEFDYATAATMASYLASKFFLADKRDHAEPVSARMLCEAQAYAKNWTDTERGTKWFCPKCTCTTKATEVRRG